MKVNVTISDSSIRIDYLKDDNVTVSGVDFFYTDTLKRLRDEKDGWWFDRYDEVEYNRKLYFNSILNFNGDPIGGATQHDITVLILLAKLSQQPSPSGRVVTTVGGDYITSVDGKFILTTDGFQEL